MLAVAPGASCREPPPGLQMAWGKPRGQETRAGQGFPQEEKSAEVPPQRWRRNPACPLPGPGQGTSPPSPSQMHTQPYRRGVGAPPHGHLRDVKRRASVTQPRDCPQQAGPAGPGLGRRAAGGRQYLQLLQLAQVALALRHHVPHLVLVLVLLLQPLGLLPLLLLLGELARGGASGPAWGAGSPSRDGLQGTSGCAPTAESPRPQWRPSLCPQGAPATWWGRDTPA